MRRVALLLCLILPAACGAPTRTGGEPRVLAGREFVSDRVEGRALVGGTTISLRFEERALSATAGCNSLGGPYRLEGFNGATGTVVVDGGGLSMTEIGCDPPRHDQDTWLADLLLAKPTVSLPDDDQMTLTDGTSTIHFVDREVADPDRPLVDTTWKVDSIITGDAVSSVPENGSVTFVFGGDGRLVVTSDKCTSAAVSYEQSGEQITLGSYTVDDIGCPSPWAETLALLDAKSLAFTIDHARLTLTASSGKGLSLTAS
jgi:heat shock protein HslJ